ncbi:hypothetical protein [Streptomyces tsukubensis]|uniref:hypothetical protein n=1 Tax=Streptomyces tsukubensis TaxID=83656 RepID=UPI0015C3A52F|nr:hypothetical protein [Streptomyces tsukubensis]
MTVLRGPSTRKIALTVASADEAAFTLRAPGGVIPGESAAQGALKVAAGTLIGPVQAGS